MANPSILVNTYNIGNNGSPTGHVNVTFIDSSGNNVGTYGAQWDIGGSSLPGELGLVKAEDPSRPVDYQQQIIFTDPSESAWSNALHYAQQTAAAGAGGAGEYFPVFNNCYDFVDDVLQHAGYGNNTTWQFMPTNSLIYDYGYVQYLVVNAWEWTLWNWTNNPDAAIDDYTRVQNAKYLIDLQGSEDDVVVEGRIDHAEQNTYLSPIALDLDGNGFTVISSEASGVAFDLAGDGSALKTAWLDGSDGFLVRDANGDGAISDGSEMFGGRLADDGFNKLAAMDSDGNSIIDANDDGWGELKVWVDADVNGVSSLIEIFGLSELGITSLDLSYEDSSTRVGTHGYISLTSTAQTTNGSIEMADIFFKVDGLADAD
jgi:hypothetical protein